MRRLAEHGRIIAAAAKRFWFDHGPEQAGNMAFLGLLALFPYLIILLSVSGLVGATGAGRRAIAFFLGYLPPDVATNIAPIVDSIVEGTSRGVLTTSIVFAFWSAISGIEAARQTVIHAHDSWQHAASIWRRLLADIAIILITVLLITLAMSLIVLVPPLLAWLGQFIPIPEAVEQYSLIARYVLAPLLLFATLVALYKAFSPRMPGHRRFYLPGAIFALVIWTALGKAMAVYLRFASTYDLFYGSLAGVVLLLLFLYIVAAAFILGAHLNAAYCREKGCKALAT
ncbi:MAG: hypothetical protein Kow00104_06090 [Rhodothalassiaceae bacterium]